MSTPDFLIKSRVIEQDSGVQIRPFSKEIAESLCLINEKGAFISNLNPDGPAKAAGLLEGDVIVKFNYFEIPIKNYIKGN